MDQRLSDLLERAERALSESRRLLETADLYRDAGLIRIMATEMAFHQQREELAAIKIHRPDDSGENRRFLARDQDVQRMAGRDSDGRSA